MFARLVTFGSAVNTFRKQHDLPAAICVGATQLMANYDLDAVFDWTDGTLLIAKEWERNNLIVIAPDFCSSSRRGNRRIVELCNCYCNEEDGRKDKQERQVIS